MVERNSKKEAKPWVEKDGKVATKTFIDGVKEAMEKKRTECQKGVGKISLENVAEADKEIAENFVCPICFYLVDIESAVTCESCETIYDSECLKQSRKNSEGCPNCRKKLKEKPMNRINKNIFSNVKVICKKCPDDQNVVKISEWKVHIAKCSAVLIDECIFCDKEDKKTSVKDISWEAWQTHVATECNGKKLRCQACDFSIYQVYSKPTVFKDFLGHNCIRDLKRQYMDIKNDFK